MSFNSSKRKLHKSYMILWNTQLSNDGYAKCLIETCNFISSDLHLMQEHYKTCKGIENHDSNLCSSCNKWMPSKEELTVHKAECNGGLKANIDIKLKRHNLDKFEIQGPDEVGCESEQNKNRLNSPDNQKKEKEVKSCKICEQVFSCDTDYLQHLIPCQENSKKILLRKSWPKTMKENIDKDDDSCIIQPGRDIPKEQYVRRRGFTKQHKIAWETAMRKYRHIKCMFQKCHFLAMSVEDMISHYGYCNGDGSFAEFVCPYCEGRVTSEEILKIHILRSHSLEDNAGSNGRVNSGSLIAESKSRGKRTSSKGAVENKKEEEEEEDKSNSESFCDTNNVENETEEVDDGPNEQNPRDNPTENSSDGVRNSTETSEETSVEYSKRKIEDYESELKKKRCLNEANETTQESESDQTRVVENETDFQSNKTNDPENNGQYVRQMVKFSVTTNPNPPRRDIRPSYTSAWNESIKKNGFARCLVATCNFISLDIFHIENHYKTCNGVPAEGPNLCSFCRSRLPSSIELWIHESVCRGNGEVTSNNSSEYKKLISKEIENSKSTTEMENPSPKTEGENRNGLNAEGGDANSGNEISLNENEIPGNEERNSLRISDIIKKRDDEGAEDKPIIQSGPDLPPGTHYTRRRPYTKTHKAAWETALKKHKYVKCMFQNCNFLAMSLEDMIYHFGYCSGNGSFANFECPYCKGRLTTESILDIHIQISHRPLEGGGGGGDGDDSVGNDDCQSEESLPSLDEMKKLVAKKEIKTYGRHPRKSKLGKSINSMKETGGGGCPAPDASKNKSEEARAEAEISVNNIVPFDPGDGNVKVSKRKNVSSASDNGNKKTREDNDVSPASRGGKTTRETDHKTVRRKRKPTSPDETVVTQSELNRVDDVKSVNSCKGDGRRGRKTRASSKSSERGEGSGNPFGNEKEKRKVENESTEVDVNEVPDVGKAKTESPAGPEPTRKTPGKRGRPRNDPEQGSTPAKRGKPGRKTKDKSSEEEKTEGAETVKCSRCDFAGARDAFVKHNYKIHGGLGWIVGEEAIDMANEKEVEKIVKTAFKFTKSAECHNCRAVKKSALGFISHLKNCGKSKEEKEALKVTCPYCPARLLSYSLPMHFKLTHSGAADSGKTETGAEENVEQLPSKRKSAIRAMNKCNEVLKEYYNDDEDVKKKNDFVLFEKKSSKPPKIAASVKATWRKMLKEKKTIACQGKGCNVESLTVQEAANHYFKCPSLPKKCYVCLLCNFYSETESTIREHVDFHPKVDGDFSVDSDDERIEEEKEKKDDELAEEDCCKVKTGESLTDETALETMYKTNFFVREKIHNERQTRFCYRSLRMTLDSELEDLKEKTRDWPGFHTRLADWAPVSLEESSRGLPSLQESMSFKVHSNGKTDKINYEKLARFSGRIIEDSAAFFTGGSILSMSWCKYSCIRSSSQIQYLAVSSSRKMEKYQNIHEECNDWSGLVQIWSCGEMLTNLQKVPKLAMGIVHDSGEVWDLSWFPTDCYSECENKSFLRRIGLLGGACRDGTVRIWSICDPEQLKNEGRLPLYKTEPVVILELEGKENVGCMRLAIGRTGVVVGGYANGMVAAWNLNGISLPFCKKSGKSYVLKPYSSFQAHRTSITALSICPNNDRYITTSGLDRYIKFWDFECFGAPFECMQKEICLENVWPRHWPMTISVFENVVPGAGKGMIKAIRNAYSEKHTAPLSLDGTCWGLSFNDWLNVLCGCNSVGEVKIRYLRNMFLTDEKFKLRAGNLFSTTEVKLLRQEEDEECDGKKKEKKKKVSEGSIGPRTYEEASQYFGLVIKDHAIDHEKVKSAQTGKKGSQSMEDYPISSVNKVCWNPNYTSFMHLAIGYQCGLIRIKTLSDPKCAQEVSEFFDEAKEKISTRSGAD